MYSEQMAPALRTYLTHLREDAYLDIKPGFVDSGASPNETKPVFTAYAPPAPKKKSAIDKKRFDRGGKFSPAGATVAGATTAGAAPVATAASAQPLATVQLDKHGKPKKIKREKIRYGQAPRVALPAAPEGSETAAAPATETAAAPAAAPGTALAPVDSNNTVSAAEDPLAPKTPEKAKTRFSSRAATFKQEKAAKVSKKSADKAAATPTPITTEESQTQKTQAAPLGLNGDTVKKKKKKRQKGEKKERLQGKPIQKAAPLTANPMPDKKTGLPPQKPAADSTTPAETPQPSTPPPASVPPPQ